MRCNSSSVSPLVSVSSVRVTPFNDIADGDVMVSLDGLPDDVVVDPTAGTIALNPAMTYGRLASTLHANHVALHNLASLPHISVAGAITTATHGSGDRFGNLATAVSAIDLLRSDGEIVHLDRSSAEFAGAVVNARITGRRHSRPTRRRARVRRDAARVRRLGVGRAVGQLRRRHRRRRQRQLVHHVCQGARRTGLGQAPDRRPAQAWM